MADGSEDSAGLGLIVGILAAVVVIIFAIGVGPRIFRGPTAPPDVNVIVEPPKLPAPPAPRG